MPTSKLENELVKATKARQAAGEARGKYFVRLLHEGQKMTAPIWDTLSAEAQQWYNDSVKLYQAHNNPADIKEFPDITSGVQRATLATVEPIVEPEPEVVEAEPEDEEVPAEEEPVDEPVNGDDEEEIEEEEVPAEEDEEFEEEVIPVEEPDEPVPLQAAKQPPPKQQKPKQQPAKPKPAVKPPSRPTKPIKTEATVNVVELRVKDKAAATLTTDGGNGMSRPPKPSVPGASTMIKRLLIKDINVTNAELMEKLREHGISVTAISVSTIRSDFRHSLRVLHEAGLCKEIAAL